MNLHRQCYLGRCAHEVRQWNMSNDCSDKYLMVTWFVCFVMWTDNVCDCLSTDYRVHSKWLQCRTRLLSNIQDRVEILTFTNNFVAVSSGVIKWKLKYLAAFLFIQDTLWQSNFEKSVWDHRFQFIHKTRTCMACVSCCVFVRINCRACCSVHFCRCLQSSSTLAMRTTMAAQTMSVWYVIHSITCHLFFHSLTVIHFHSLTHHSQYYVSFVGSNVIHSKSDTLFTTVMWQSCHAVDIWLLVNSVIICCWCSNDGYFCKCLISVHIGIFCPVLSSLTIRLCCCCCCCCCCCWWWWWCNLLLLYCDVCCMQCLNLSEEELAERELDFVDIAFDELAEKCYKVEEVCH